MTTQDKMRAKAAKLRAPKPRELPSGAWRCEVMVQGRRISVVEDDPEVAHAKALAIKTGMIQEKKSPAALTVGEAIDRYIESKDAVLSPATVAGYKRVRKNNMQELMDITLPALTQERVQRAVNAMARDHSPKSVRNAHGLLSAVLAEYWPDMVLRTTLPQKRRYDAAIPSDADIQAIMDTARGSKDELPILLAVWLGLRMSEILGLKWEDIDLERGDLRVKRQVSRINGEVVEAPLKTKNAYRTLPLAEDTIGVLKEQRRKVGSSPWVFPSPNGGPISPDSVLHMLHRVLKRAGLPKVRFHDLRHTFATLALQNGVDIKTVSGMLGHFSAGFTLDTYTHVTSAAQRQAAQTMGNVLSGSL